jgi:hypothetical protein
MEETHMLESFRAAGRRRINGRRSRLELELLQAELGSFASDVDLDRFDLELPPGRVQDEQTKALRQLLAMQIVTY